MDLTYPQVMFAGVNALLTPAILLFLPVYVSVVLGTLLDEGDVRAKDIGRAGWVVGLLTLVGFGVTFFVASAQVLSLPTQYGVYLRYVVGLAFFVWGVKMVLGMRMTRRAKPIAEDWPISAYMALFLGAGLTQGWAPSSGPVLGQIYMKLIDGQQPGQGLDLLIWYILGLTTVLVLLLWGLIALSKVLRRVAGRPVEIICGCVLVSVSGLIGTGYVPVFIDKLMRLFPQLSQFG